MRDGRIAAVGDLAGASAARTLDCTGKVIAPGFIDMHSHSDWVIPQPDHADVLAPLLEQGITTIVAGNCGCSPAPYLPGNRELLPLVGRMLHDHDLDYALVAAWRASRPASSGAAWRSTSPSSSATAPCAPR